MPNNKSSGIFHYAAILRVLMNSTVIKLRNSDNNKTGLGEIVHLVMQKSICSFFVHTDYGALPQTPVTFLS